MSCVLSIKKNNSEDASTFQSDKQSHIRRNSFPPRHSSDVDPSDSVFHWTDVPSIVSGDYLVMFDPHARYVPGATDLSRGKFFLTLNLSVNLLLVSSQVMTTSSNSYFQHKIDNDMKKM